MIFTCLGKIHRQQTDTRVQIYSRSKNNDLKVFLKIKEIHYQFLLNLVLKVALKTIGCSYEF